MNYKILLCSLVWIALDYGCLAQKNPNVTRKRELQPNERSYILFYEKDGSHKFISLLNKSIQLTKYRNQDQYLIIQKYYSTDGNNTDSSFYDLKTLMPAYYSNTGNEIYEQTTFFKDSIRTLIKEMDSTHRISSTNYQHFSSVMLDDLLTTLPLNTNQVFTFDLVTPGKRFRQSKANISVIGKEAIGISKHVKLECWKILVEIGELKSFWWITIEDQIPLKSSTKLNSGITLNRRLIIP